MQDCYTPTINNIRHEIPSPLFDGKLRRNLVKKTNQLNKALSAAEQVHGKKRKLSKTKNSSQIKRSNSFQVSMISNSEKQSNGFTSSDDSVDYAINLLKASSSEVSNKKRKSSTSNTTILNVLENTFLKNKKPKKKLKKNNSKTNSSTLNSTNGNKINGYKNNKRYYNNFHVNGNLKKTNAKKNKNNHNDPSFQGQKATKPKKKKRPQKI